jgi:NAD(P)-dependent dehydrogenase (short-subunit alcohol dehydrogenase family)
MSSPQSPIHSGFGPSSSASDVIGNADLRGKIAIVTGGYSGLGLETTRALAAAGATVVVPVRAPSGARARTALAGIVNVELAALDLLDPASIAAFAAGFVAGGRPLHMLVNNAGIMATPLARDGRGYETQFSANHLGHFQLTAQLLPALQKAGGARIVALSSRGHRFGGVDLADPNFQHRDYDKWKAYGQSKTANILFALELDRRAAASGIRAFSVHPGRIATTDLVRHLSEDDFRAFGLLDEHGKRVADTKSKTSEQGAATSVWCAVSPQLDGYGGVYCEDADISPAIAGDTPGDAAGVRPWAINAADAERLWAISEALTGVTYAL